MASPSKEENILKLILENSPLKEWHFEEIVKSAKVTKSVANKWLKKYVSEGLLKHVKEEGRFPHYTVGSNNPVYYSQKRVYALEQLHKSGLIPKLLSLNTAKTIIIFGSIIKGDWYKDSDIDIFIFGDISDFDKKVYELKLYKNIELHIFENKEEINEVKTGLIKNILNGYILKGQIQDFAGVV
ncbi:nucleotidyltransferase domain-containing protein [Candidatus Woesearchaeota archaeon]|nr:nucleotidyltransferase domain-containing protein [Candidatus Woesearchaeota archaeon]